MPDIYVEIKIKMFYGAREAYLMEACGPFAVLSSTATESVVNNP